MKNDKGRFFHCKHCGNLTGLIHSSGVPMVAVEKYD